ncbi:putative nucleoredoxin 1-2 [Curcuma longa]|uniref:putative nucleoredoxin 1-2 n=1 Tax=Curcuma longa TaxID=136217 RepID=UPI003D9EE485
MAAKEVGDIVSLLSTDERNFLVNSNGEKVPISDLQGKTVALYFSYTYFRTCAEFTPVLAQIDRKLKEVGQSFEVVQVLLDDEKLSYNEAIESTSWLAVPFNDQTVSGLLKHFGVTSFPTLLLIGSDGKTVDVNFTELVEELAVEAWEAFLFSQEKLVKLLEKAKAKRDAQTLESLLVSGDIDYVIDTQGFKVPVRELVGKTILLYFSSFLCPPCRAFLPKLVEYYHQIRNVDSAFEVIFVSSDRDRASFEEFFSAMPWLALPFGDERKESLARSFRISMLPSLVALDPSGRTLAKDAKRLFTILGADAYPFTEEKIREAERRTEEMAKGWPEKINHDHLHEHELALARCSSLDYCHACEEMGSIWLYSCNKCRFSLHPQCALKEDKEDRHNGENHEAAMDKEGYVCDGEPNPRISGDNLVICVAAAFVGCVQEAT